MPPHGRWYALDRSPTVRASATLSWPIPGPPKSPRCPLSTPWADFFVSQWKSTKTRFWSNSFLFSLLFLIFLFWIHNCFPHKPAQLQIPPAYQLRFWYRQWKAFICPRSAKSDSTENSKFWSGDSFFSRFGNGLAEWETCFLFALWWFSTFADFISFLMNWYYHWKIYFKKAFFYNSLILGSSKKGSTYRYATFIHEIWDFTITVWKFSQFFLTQVFPSSCFSGGGGAIPRAVSHAALTVNSSVISRTVRWTGGFLTCLLFKLVHQREKCASSASDFV